MQMNIELPEALQQFVQKQAAAAGLNSGSEYVCSLVRAEAFRKSRSDLEAEILEGLNSGEAEPFTDEEWAGFREEVRASARARREQA